MSARTLRKRRAAWVLAALACTTAAPGAAHASSARLRAFPLRLEPPPKQAVAVVRGGVVWFDGGPVVFEHFSGGAATLGEVGVGPKGRPEAHMESSTSAVAGLLRSDGEFTGGVLPAPLSAIPQPKSVSGGGCQGWEPATRHQIGNFVVAGDELVSAAECDRELLPGTEVEVVGPQTFERQPLFVRSLRGGSWRVLRWLAGDLPPVLATEGTRIAIGVQFSLLKMEVSIVDVRSGRTESHFGVPAGYLAFASRDRLVLSAPAWEREFGTFPLQPLRLRERAYFHGGPAKSYELALYSTRGRQLTQLGSAPEPPLVSNMHLVTAAVPEDPASREAQLVVSLRSLSGAQPRRVIGFSAPGRRLIALAFSWPALVVVQTTRAPRSQGELTCWNDEYQPPSNPFLGIFDLALAEPFVPAPPPPHLVRPAPNTCGPAPPVVHYASAQ